MAKRIETPEAGTINTSVNISPAQGQACSFEFGLNP